MYVLTILNMKNSQIYTKGQDAVDRVPVAIICIYTTFQIFKKEPEMDIQNDIQSND